MSTTPTKDAARQVIEGSRDALVALSHRIHSHPELCFEEYRSAEATASHLSAGGFQIEEKAAGLDTAFVARFGSGALKVVICAEYDALPSVGHACGHNIIAACAVGAGLALAPLADDLDITVEVVGTPAEEGGGGKALMIDAGVFAETHLAMMVHPWPTERLTAQCLAVSHFDATFHGKDAHASAAPYRGINAADAITIANVALGLLRQQLNPGDQVHGITTIGGQAANIIPSLVEGRYMARSRTIDGLGHLVGQVHRCFEAGALATGCTLHLSQVGPDYTHMEPDEAILGIYRHAMEEVGRSFTDDDSGAALPTVSTDMANVSLVVPTIHPLIGIETNGAVNHQPEFTAACITESADRAVIEGALAMAWTIIETASDDEQRQRLMAAQARR